MQVSVIVIVLLGLMAVGYHFGRQRALGSVGGGKGIRQLHSLPSYYGAYVVLWGALPALVVWWLWKKRTDPLRGWRLQMEPELLAALLVGNKNTSPNPAGWLLAAW